MFDWNRNGKQDAGDSFMEFMIFNAVINEDKSRSSQSATGSMSWRSSTRWRTRTNNAAKRQDFSAVLAYFDKKACDRSRYVI